jgi:uncharacterized protein
MQNSSNRIPFLDALRGFALFGLLVVHIPLFGFAEDFLYGQDKESIYLYEGIARSIYQGLFDGKFFPIFSFLFGIGFAIQMKGDTRQDQNKFLSRLLGLSIFGVLHSLLFFNGDILFSYSILGLILYKLRYKENSYLLKYALIGVVVSGISYFIIGFYFNKNIDFTEMSALTRPASSGNYHDILAFHRAHFFTDFGFILLFNWPSAFAMLSLGYWVGKKEIHLLENPFGIFGKQSLPKIFSIGILGNIPIILSIWDLIPESWGMSILGLTAPCLSLFYIFLFYKSFKKFHNTILFKLFQNSGQMSLTVYLSESILMSFFFQGWGLGQFEKWSYESSLLLSIPFFLLLSGFATLWLKNFQQGPMEILLRTLVKKLSNHLN